MIYFRGANFVKVKGAEASVVKFFKRLLEAKTSAVVQRKKTNKMMLCFAMTEPTPTTQSELGLLSEKRG